MHPDVTGHMVNSKGSLALEGNQMIMLRFTVRKEQIFGIILVCYILCEEIYCEKTVNTFNCFSKVLIHVV